MAAMITSGTINTCSGIASAEEIRKAFIETNPALTWLAEFLTGDEVMATACVIDACTLTEREFDVGRPWFRTWLRNATIRSALDIQRSRIAQLAPAYNGGVCAHGHHAPLSQDMIGFLASESEAIGRHLDVFCRFVLILCGVERRSSGEVALLLGISHYAVKAAYCVVLGWLEVIRCQAIIDSCYCFAAGN